MKDFYEKYLDKEQLIEQACDCIDANNCDKLKEEINEIKTAIGNLSLDDSWQDKAGDAFKKMIKSCVKTFDSLIESISTEFKNSEKIYKMIKLKLQQLKKANETYQDTYEDEPVQSSYKKTVNRIINGVTKQVTIDDTSAYKTAHDDWDDTIENLETKCIDLSKEIDEYFKQLEEIDGVKVLNSVKLTLPKFNNSIKNFSNAIGKFGTFIADKVGNGKYGTFVSSVDGKEHIIYNQKQIDGWKGFCNRAAAACLASGFCDGDFTAVDTANETSKINNQIGYDSDATSLYFSKFGLNSTVNKVNCSYDAVKEKIVSSLKNGELVMFDLSEPGVVGQSGQKWTGERHWLAVLDMREGENGIEVFISDSAHDGSTADYGLGQGWYSIDEFDGKKVANVTVVSEANKSSNTSTTVTVSTAKQTDTSPVQYTTEIPDTVSQLDSHTVTCYEKDGWHFGASSKGSKVGVGTGQKLVHDAWNSQGSNYENGVAVIDDDGTKRILVACTEKIGKVGDRITINYGNGQKVEALVADQKSKGDGNYSELGHKYGNQTSIIELEVNTQDFIDKKNPKTETWGLSWDTSSPITSIDNHGSAKEALASQNGVKV